MPMTGSGVTDRVVIITGGARGIGRGLARHLGQAGAHVVITGRTTSLIDETVLELQKDDISIMGFTSDVRDRDQIQNVVKTVIEHFGRVDGLVNNAITHAPQRPIEDITEDDLDTEYTSAVKGALWFMQAVYPHMKSAGWGRIVNTASGAGVIGFKGFGAYNMVKEAIRALTRTAAREWAQDGIIVNCYCPFAMAALPEYWKDGDLAALRQPAADYVEMAMAAWAGLTPAGFDGDPEQDLGPVIEFLLSDACHYLSGHTLMLDGGAYSFA